MKKVVLGFCAVASLTLTGCLSTGEQVSLTNLDFQNMSCEQIESEFKSYKDTMETTGTAASLVSMVSSSAASSANAARSSAMQMYNQAKRIAQPVLKAKNCNVYI